MDWTITPFNPLFCTIFALLIAILAIVSFALRKAKTSTKKAVLVTVCILTLIGFFVYKYALSIDREYDALLTASGEGGFNWWNELPLHLCNVNMILIPIAVLFDRRRLMGFSFFMGTLGAALALVLPGTGFDAYSLLLPRMLGYYGTHYMIVIEALALAAFGFFRPRFRDIPAILAESFGITFVAFLIDLAFRKSGLYAYANYFYAYEPAKGNPILNLFYSWIPLPYLYLLPSLVILAVYMAVIISGFEIGKRIREGKKERQTARKSV